VFRNFGLVNYDPELTELGQKFRVSSAPEFEIHKFRMESLPLVVGETRIRLGPQHTAYDWATG
jgi:hypothetical protein